MNLPVARCPYCGTMHHLKTYNYENLCLDGTPQLSMRKLMQRFAICSKCGLIYSTQVDDIMPVKNILQSQQYQDALQVHYDDNTERKLMILGALCQPGYVPLFLAHHYAETYQPIKRREMLKCAVEYIASGKDNYVHNITKCGPLHFRSPILLYPEHRLIDLYRQMSRWEDAKKHIQTIRENQPKAATKDLGQYLDYEEKLIAQKNSEVQ